jgi:ABC-2 type transport system permease protein
MYVWYQKGGQILYTLADYIGEDKFNLALHNFLMQYRYANANNQVDANSTVRTANTFDDPYPDTRMLVDAIRPRLRPSSSTWSTTVSIASFSTTTKAISATSQKTPTASTKSLSKSKARKVQADGNGAETPMPLTTTSRSASSAARRMKRSPSI